MMALDAVARAQGPVDATVQMSTAPYRRPTAK
jgi:hypothetical protein